MKTSLLNSSFAVSKPKRSPRCLNRKTFLTGSIFGTKPLYHLRRYKTLHLFHLLHLQHQSSLNKSQKLMFPTPTPEIATRRNRSSANSGGTSKQEVQSSPL